MVNIIKLWLYDKRDCKLVGVKQDMIEICKQIEQIHSEWSKMNLTDKMVYIIEEQTKINSCANQLAHNRMFRGYFTLEEKVAIQQLQDIQNEINAHKADVNMEIHNEIGKELFKTLANLR